MKKLFVYFVFGAVMALSALHTKAENTEPKKPFVEWASVPKDNNMQNVVSWLKLAMQGKSIEGAVVHANAGNYRSVWGSYYDQILSATTDRFRGGYASGTEKNFGIADGVAVHEKYMKQGTPIVEFRLSSGSWVPIAKWGSNGCLNATPIVLNDYVYEDPDLQDGPVVSQRPPVTPQNPNSGVTNTVTVGASGGQEHSWWLSGHNEGRNERERDLLFDMVVFKEIQASKNCNPCGTSGSSGFVSTASFQVAQTAPVTFQQAPPAQQVVYAQQPRNTFWQTAGAVAVGSTVGNVVGEGLNRWIYGAQPVRVVGNYQQSYYSGYSGYYPQYPSSGGFQGSNQPGGNSLPYNNGTGGGGYNNTFFQGQ